MTLNAPYRFSDRVANYVKYRPAYPEELIHFLKEEGLLKPESLIADVGSGTGIAAGLFLKNGHVVHGVEPNKEMREAAEDFLKEEKGFHSINGKAESTTLQNNSMDIVLAAQAFHWFDMELCKTEFKRLLKPDGIVLLMWNDRRTDSTDFLKVYEDFLQLFGTDYKEINHKNIQNDEVFNAFFGEGNWKYRSFYNYQEVDFEGLKGRVLSSSYMPNEGHKDYDFMIYCLKKIFLRYQEKGIVRLDYDTKLYYGKLK